MLWWEDPELAWGYDVVRGDVDQLRAAGGFGAATEECLADDHAGDRPRLRGLAGTGPGPLVPDPAP